MSASTWISKLSATCWTKRIELNDINNSYCMWICSIHNSNFDSHTGQSCTEHTALASHFRSSLKRFFFHEDNQLFSSEIWGFRTWNLDQVTSFICIITFLGRIYGILEINYIRNIIHATLSVSLTSIRICPILTCPALPGLDPLPHHNHTEEHKCFMPLIHHNQDILTSISSSHSSPWINTNNWPIIYWY